MPDGVGDTTVNQTPTHPRSHAAHRTGRAIGWRKSHSQPGRPGGLPGTGNEEPERLQVEVGRCQAGIEHRRESMCPAFAQLFLFKWSLSRYFISLSFSFLIRKNRHNRTLTFPFVSTPKTVPGPFSHNLTKDHSSGQFPQSYGLNALMTQILNSTFCMKPSPSSLLHFHLPRGHLFTQSFIPQASMGHLSVPSTVPGARDRKTNQTQFPLSRSSEPWSYHAHRTIICKPICCPHKTTPYGRRQHLSTSTVWWSQQMLTNTSILPGLSWIG